MAPPQQSRMVIWAVATLQGLRAANRVAELAAWISLPGDFSGDNKADLAVILASGALHLFTGNVAGAFTETGSMWRDTSWSTIKLAA